MERAGQLAAQLAVQLAVQLAFGLAESPTYGPRSAASTPILAIKASFFSVAEFFNKNKTNYFSALQTF